MNGVSVLLPVKDASRTIRLSITSALLAMRQSDELLVLNDGSQDNTLEVLESVRDSRIKIYSTARSLGPGLGTNYLAQRAQNEIIARIDGDDIYLPNRFSEKMRESVLSNNGFVFSNMLLLKRGIIVPQPPRRLTGIDVYRSLVGANPLNNPTMMGSKSTFLKSGGYSHGVGCDKNLWLRFALEGVPMALQRSYTVVYRLHPGQRSKSQDPRDESISSLEMALSNKLRGSG